MAEAISGAEESQDEDKDAEEKDTEEKGIEGVGNESAQKSPEQSTNKDPFMAETRYVVLNFMSLIPRDLYQNHLSSSPESAISDLSVGDSFNKNVHPLGIQGKIHHQPVKSRSFDIPPQRKVPKLKQLSHLKFSEEVESPASEDNLNYRYRHYLHQLDQPSIPENSPCSPEISSIPEVNNHYPFNLKSQSIPSLKSESPGSVSPRKTPHSLSRWFSDISSSGDLSYASDADDEAEDLSNASSAFSIRSACLRRDGFLDLRKPLPRLTTVMSQSEVELDEVDGLYHSVDETFQPMPPVVVEQTNQADAINNNKNDIDKNDTQTTDLVSEANKDTSNTKTPSPRKESSLLKQHSKDSTRSHTQSHLRSHDHQACHTSHHHHHPVPGSSFQTDGIDNGECSDRRMADRSKLKLDIPTQIVEIDDILVSLQTELNSEITDLESEFEEALRSSSNASARPHNTPTPVTPTSEAAMILARIGDEVNAQYGSHISAAVNKVMLEQIKDLTYTQFKEIAKTVIDENLPGWRQVALLMLFGQKMIWKALEKGQKQFGSLVDFSVQLVADVAADFIIREGGWGAVMNFDPSQSSDSQSSAVSDRSPGIIDYFSSHNVTQVESGEMKDLDFSSSGTNVDSGLKLKEKDRNQYDGSGEPADGKREPVHDSDHDNGFSNNSSDLNESIDGVFDENKNQNAQSEDQFLDPDRLNTSGRELKPSLGFEYRNEPQSGRSDISSAGFKYSESDYVQNRFDYDVDPSDSTGDNRNKNTTKTNINRNNGRESMEQTDSDKVPIKETANASLRSQSAEGRNDSTEGYTHDRTHNNENLPVESLKDTKSKDDNTDNTREDTDRNASLDDTRNDEDNRWYSSFRRLGYGALGMSLGVLALAVAVRQMR